MSSSSQAIAAPRGVADWTLEAPGASRVAVIVPCFNESDSIGSTLTALGAVLESIGPHQLIVVDDGSTDGSSDAIARVAADDVALEVVKHQRNRGYGAALKSGIRQARSEWIVIADADGTYPVERLPDLLARTRESDMVVGARVDPDGKYPFARKVPKWFLGGLVSWLADVSVPDFNSGFRVFRRSIAKDYLHLLPDGFSFTTTITLIMLTNSYRVAFEPVRYSERSGRSKIRPVRDTLNFFQIILRLGMVFRPLRVLAPLIVAFGLGAAVSLGFDIFVANDITDKTLLLIFLAVNTTMFALLADMIDRRTRR